MLVRLNKLIARAGVCSRREADRLIEEGRVAVNGRVVQELGAKVDDEKDRVVVDGRPVKPAAPHPVYVLLNKPEGYVVTAKDPLGRKTVMDLVRLPGVRLFPVGRLDAATRGALLLTNDGELALKLSHPRYGVRKVYDVRVKGVPGEKELELLRKGVFLEGRRTAPARIAVARAGRASARLLVELHEGRKREVRKMFEALSFPVQSLVRTEFAGLTLAGLKPGGWRFLKPWETARLKKLAAGD
jgi:pseudouridine synthase